jgi:hypothetical protein
VNWRVSLFDYALIGPGTFTPVHINQIQEGPILVPVEAEGSESRSPGFPGPDRFHWKHWGVIVR